MNLICRPSDAELVKTAGETAVKAYVTSLNRFTEEDTTQGALDASSKIEARAEAIMFDEHHITRCPEYDFGHQLGL